MKDLTDSMARYLIGARSDSTVHKYVSEFKRWERFIVNRGGLSISAQPIQVALYLTYLLDNNCSSHVVQSAFYSIKWVHSISGHTDPTENSYVQNLLEASKRQSNNKPRVKKDHISSEHIIELCSKYSVSTDLMIVRDLAMIVLGFAGFLRFNELSSLRCNDILFKDNHLHLYIRKSKTDQYRMGDSIVIAKGESAACPYNLLQKYFSLALIQPGSDNFLFRPIFRSRNICSLIYKYKPLSYTRTRECVVSRLKEVCGELNIGLHSLRAGEQQRLLIVRLTRGVGRGTDVGKVIVQKMDM